MRCTPTIQVDLVHWYDQWSGTNDQWPNIWWSDNAICTHFYDKCHNNFDIMICMSTFHCLFRYHTTGHVHFKKSHLAELVNIGTYTPKLI